jgi:hypothetical protein
MPSAPLPVDTPAGTVQRYLAAYLDGDMATAYGCFSSRVQERMTQRSFERTAAAWAREELRHQRIVLDRVETDAEGATVHVVVESATGGGLFDHGRYGWGTSVRLVQEEGEWRIDEPLAGIQPSYEE